MIYSDITIEMWLAAVGVALGAGGIVVAKNQFTRLSIAFFVLVVIAFGMLGVRSLYLEKEINEAETRILGEVGSVSKTRFQLVRALSNAEIGPGVAEEALSRLLRAGRLQVTPHNFYARAVEETKASTDVYSTLFYCSPSHSRSNRCGL